MNIKDSIERLKRREEFLESKVKDPESRHLDHFRADLAANTTALKCMEIMLTYGFVAVASYDDEFWGPLVPGQSGIPKRWPPIPKSNPRLKKGTPSPESQE